MNTEKLMRRFTILSCYHNIIIYNYLVFSYNVLGVQNTSICLFCLPNSRRPTLNFVYNLQLFNLFFFRSILYLLKPIYQTLLKLNCLRGQGERFFAKNRRETQDKRLLGRDPYRRWCHRRRSVKLFGRSP